MDEHQYRTDGGQAYGPPPNHNEFAASQAFGDPCRETRDALASVVVRLERTLSDVEAKAERLEGLVADLRADHRAVLFQARCAEDEIDRLAAALSALKPEFPDDDAFPAPMDVPPNLRRMTDSPQA